MAPVLIKINLLLLILIPTAQVFAQAMKIEERAAVGQYITERKRITAAAAPVVDKLGEQAMKKLDEFEKKLVPILIWIDQRSAEIVADEAAMDRTMAQLKEQANFNPYADTEWKESARKDLVQLCCEIKANPRRQQQIQNRVAQGLPALIPGGNRAGGGQGQAQGQGQGTGMARGGGFNQKLGAGGQGGGRRGGAGAGAGRRGGGGGAQGQGQGGGRRGGGVRGGG